MAGRELKPCGTHAAAMRHRRRGEPLCEECLAAERKHKAQMVARRAAKISQAVEEHIQAAPSDSLRRVDRREVLLQIFDVLEANLHQALPQSVAGIAREQRAVLAELAALDGDVHEDTQEKVNGGDPLDELARRRQMRVANA
ncbi:hypothetical protein [Trueperella sp. LYQ141]|uniref:hypothetical protein n=1 Tax=Trueperella sp. LYQ141 TaxID=3391058 RepID=UPI003983607C